MIKSGKIYNTHYKMFFRKSPNGIPEISVAYGKTIPVKSRHSKYRESILSDAAVFGLPPLKVTVRSILLKVRWKKKHRNGTEIGNGSFAKEDSLCNYNTVTSIWLVSNSKYDLDKSKGITILLCHLFHLIICAIHCYLFYFVLRSWLSNLLDCLVI